MRIKGHTEIQLRDARTGRLVQCTHDDNMVTNGLAGFLKNHGMLNDTPFTSAVDSDLITTLMGGILLFNDTLAENAGNIACPDGIKMTANAAHGVTHTGDPTELGSYDANESGWQNASHTVYRLVYNWTTSQGNGVIKSAALTSRAHGFVGEGNSQSEGKATNADNNNETFGNWKDVGSRWYTLSELVFAVKNNVAYALKIDTTQQTLTILKSSVNDTVCDIRNARDFRNLTFEEVAELSNPSSLSLVTTYGGQVSVRFVTGAVIMALAASNGILVLTLSSDMTSITDYAEITAAATSLTLGLNDQFFLTKDGDYLITYNTEASKMYKIEVANPTNVSEVPIVGTPTFDITAKEFMSVGKRHYVSDYVYDETLNKAIVTNNGALFNVHSGDIYKDDSTLIGYMSGRNTSSGFFGRNNMYLATINNLSNIVTKDSTQTMKVIYTLTFS